MLNYSVGLKRPFQDLGKLLIGIILSIIPIVNLIAMGYALECVSTVLKKKKSYALPEWKNFWRLFIRGLAAGVIGFVYALPALIILGVLMFNMIETFMEISDPIVIITTLLTNNAPLVLLGIILLLVSSFLTPLAVINYVKYDSFGAGFKFSEVFSKISPTYLLTWIITIVYSFILGAILGIIPYVGTGIASFIAMITTYTWIAEAYKG
jgi:hypothetical protein